MAEEEPRKRSRFDQTEPPRKSRFDRRSRSPARRDSDIRRSRSPVTKSIESPGGDNDSKKDAAAAAAAAAARINASIHAKKGIQHVEVPPIIPVIYTHTHGHGQSRYWEWCADGDGVSQAQSPSAGAAGAKSPSQSGGALKDEIYTQDGDYIKDIEVNDLRNRYTLTKGSTQKMVNTTLFAHEPTDYLQPHHNILLCDGLSSYLLLSPLEEHEILDLHIVVHAAAAGPD